MELHAHVLPLEKAQASHKTGLGAFSLIGPTVRIRW